MSAYAESNSAATNYSILLVLNPLSAYVCTLGLDEFQNC